MNREIAVSLLLIVLVTHMIPAGLGLTVDDVSSDLRCVCTMDCAMYLSSCTCETADKMRDQIQGMIEQGMSKEQIINVMQQIYGEDVLATPPKSGFNLVLWMYPIVGLAVGGLIIYAITKRRRRAKWYVDPDEILEMSEDEFIQKVEAGDEEALTRYEEFLEEEYEKFKRRKKGKGE